MKAKFVYENLDFERGGDIKDTIGIGEKVAFLKEFLKSWPYRKGIKVVDKIIYRNANIFILQEPGGTYFVSTLDFKNPISIMSPSSDETAGLKIIKERIDLMPESDKSFSDINYTT